MGDFACCRVRGSAGAWYGMSIACWRGSSPRLWGEFTIAMGRWREGMRVVIARVACGCNNGRYAGCSGILNCRSCYMLSVGRIEEDGGGRRMWAWQVPSRHVSECRITLAGRGEVLTVRWPVASRLSERHQVVLVTSVSGGVSVWQLQ